MRHYDMEKQNYGYLFHLAYKTDGEALACLRTARIYKVDDETAVLEDYDITPQMWPEIDEADKKEIQQFVDEKAFKPIHRLQLTQDMVKIDAKWVRKWKRYPDKSVKMKSRLCARGCLDQQKTQLTTRSTTATRLSQRLLVSQAARKKGKTIESWDIAGAFLKGFDFKSIQKALQKMGLSAPTRQVVIYPPMNVWRHLAKMSDMFKIPEHAIHDYGLLCLKPVYGLNDAPLAWQLSLHTFLEELGATRSKMDENCFYWKKENKKKIDAMDNMYAMITTHVDDLAVMSTTTWLDEHYNKFVKRFQKVTRQQLPFDHCGCHYSKTGDGFAVTQKEFAEKMKEAPVPKRADDSRLTPEEISDFRSILGALLWVTATRLDIISDVSLLQARVTIAEVKDIKVANSVLDKVKRYSEIGLHYRQFESENLRLVCVHDASSASKGRHYAQEGVLILLADDKWKGHHIDLEEEFDSQSVKAHGGVMHLLHSHGAKAKRVSYSTSHAETLSMVNALESSILITTRLSELAHHLVSPTIAQLTEMQEHGNPTIPSDFYTDCQDLWELVTGMLTLPQDKSQRLYILGIREARLCGRIRLFTLVPTQSMLADGLTKPMESPALLLLLSAGKVTMFGVDGHPVKSRVLPSLGNMEENDLLMSDEEIMTAVKPDHERLVASHATMLCGMMATSTMRTMRLVMTAALMATGADGAETEEETTGRTEEGGYSGVYMMMFVTVVMAIVVEKVISHMMDYFRKKDTAGRLQNDMVIPGIYAQQSMFPGGPNQDQKKKRKVKDEQDGFRIGIFGS